MNFMRMPGVAISVACFTFCLLNGSAFAQIKAFPQAEGFGAVAKGGRGGDVYHVTNLNDTGAGSLRYGIDNAPMSGRTIVFDVGGWITIGSKLGINSDKHNITIAGQTAPGGIGIRGDQFSVGGDDIVIRHMRFRPGKDAGRVDSAGANSDAQRVIYDHISAGFSHDENFSVAASDFTLQYSDVSFGLEDHSAGSLIEQAQRLSFHHNLYAHNNTRNPKARVNETIDWVNNITYDYNNGFIAGDSDTTDYFWTANVDGNYYITGPGDTGRPMVVLGRSWNYGLYFGTNAFDNDGDAVHDGALYIGNGIDGTGLAGVVTGTYTWAAAPYATPALWKNATPQAAYERVLAEFGATPWDRDEVDALLYNDVVNRTGTIIAHENELVARGVTNGGFGALGGGSASPDTDGDGIPNYWEAKHGTNPAVANNNGDFDFDGYTDLEEYLNDRAAFAAPGPLEFTGIGRYADWRRWTNRWEPSRLDDVRINNAAAFVDAVGQKAGSLRLNQNARLYVTSGWLEVTNTLTVSAGRVEQHGGEVRVLQGGVLIFAGQYLLLGGQLNTPMLVKNDGAEFSFTGGKLQAGLIDFDLDLHGGTLATNAATELGITSTFVQGDLTIHSGVIEVLLDHLVGSVAVDGVATLGGSLAVAPQPGFTPTVGQSWQVLTADNIFGSFNNIAPGYTVEQIEDSLWLTFVGGAAVPEPATLGLLLSAGGLLITFNRRRRPVAIVILLVLCGLPSAHAVTLKTSADAELRENGTTGVGDATDTGSGTGSSLNARWNFATAPTNRNEWIALR
ncbi:MAG: PEP-CTERM sorting domain-containing protein, partial [Pirellulales bacterium]